MLFKTKYPTMIYELLMHIECKVTPNVYVLRVIWAAYVPTVKLVYRLKKNIAIMSLNYKLN